MADDAQVQSASVVQIAAATASQASAQVLVARGRPVDAGSVDASPDTPELQETPTESAPVAPASKMKAAVAALVRQATVSRTAAKDGDGQSEANTETPVVVDASIAATPTGDPAAAIVALSPLPGMTQPETFAADKPNASNVKRSAVRMPDQKIQGAQQQAITQTQTQDQTQTSNQPQDQNQSHAQATLAGFNAQSARTGLHVTLSAAEKNSSDPVGPVKFETAEQSSATTVPVLATVIGNEVSAAPVTTPLAAADRPADFTQIVDRLVAAREAAGSSNHAQPVQISVQHADFGKVSLKFTQDQGNLAVAMSSADPGFARAVQASAPAQQQQMSGDTAANQSNGQTAQRQQDTVLAQSQGQGQALGQGQGQPSSRQTSAMSRQDRTVAANHSNDSDQDRAPDRRGLFA